MRKITYLLMITLLIILPLSANASRSDDLVDVRIQLKWFHQFQFAGYYAALEQGYFRDAGLNVVLIDGGPHINPTEEVLAGKADFGIGTSGLLISKSRDLPVVAVAAIFQHSPYILIVRDDAEIQTILDLSGHTLMVEPYSEELLAYLHNQGVAINTVTMIEHSGNPLDIYDGEVVGMTAYTTTEPSILDNAGSAYRIFDPKLAGIDFYGDTLFTTRDYADKHNDVVVALRNALIDGWRHALQNQDEVIDLIVQQYKPDHGRDHLRYEADDIRRLLIPDLIEIGYMNPERWRQIANEFQAAGLMQGDVNINEFMFRPHEPDNWAWLFYTLLISVLLILIITTILAKFYTLNRSLHLEIRQRMALEEELKAQAITDYGTGVLNLRGFTAVLEREIARADRADTTLSLLEIDLDNFKSINDEYGHAAGDEVLMLVTRICQEEIRSIDSIGRIGGEEFMILLPETDIEKAHAVAKRIHARLAGTPLTLEDGRKVTFTASIGVATQDPGEDRSSFMARTDLAMYEAKKLGRNTISVSMEND